MDIDFHNVVGSEANIGLINLQKDILKYEICHKGRLNYNVNMLKVRRCIYIPIEN